MPTPKQRSTMNGPEATESAEVPMVSKEEEQHEPEPGPQKQWALCLSQTGLWNA